MLRRVENVRSYKRDLKIFIETKKSHICYVVRKVLISNIYLFWANWVSGELTKRHKPFPAQSKNRFFWPQNLPQLAADFDSIVLPITAKTATISPRMMALVVEETAKVQQEDQWPCGFSNDVFVFDTSSAILKMEWQDLMAGERVTHTAHVQPFLRSVDSNSWPLRCRSSCWSFLPMLLLTFTIYAALAMVDYVVPTRAFFVLILNFVIWENDYL